MEYKNLKIVVYVPESFADDIREALDKSGAGQIGKYSKCTFSVRGEGRFCPLKGANPYVGNVGHPEVVVEERIETICPLEKLDEVLKAVLDVHPYDQPAIDVFPLLDI